MINGPEDIEISSILAVPSSDYPFFKDLCKAVARVLSYQTWTAYDNDHWGGLKHQKDTDTDTVQLQDYILIYAIMSCHRSPVRLALHHLCQLGNHHLLQLGNHCMSQLASFSYHSTLLSPHLVGLDSNQSFNSLQHHCTSLAACGFISTRNSWSMLTPENCQNKCSLQQLKMTLSWLVLADKSQSALM